VSYLIASPEQPYVWGIHILFALFAGIIMAVFTYFQDKKKEKKEGL
jgi:hypothetical protein